MRIVVADTGPIHYLVLIDAIFVLPKLFESVMIPAAVRNEMLVPQAPETLSRWVLHPPRWLDIVPDPTREQDLSFARLDEGERSALQLALAVKADLVLMDDREGVLAAERKGLLVTGTLGILDLAANRGLVNLEAQIERLKATNFRYSQTLIDRLLELHRRTQQR